MIRLPLRLWALVPLLLSIWGCTYTSESLDSLKCERDGQREADRVCQDGIWVYASTLDMNTDMPDLDMRPPVDMPDLSDMPDMPDMCIPETDAQICQSVSRMCGSYTTTNRCNVEVTVECGMCEANAVCTQGICMIVPEDDEAFCARLNKDCGQVTALDNVGMTRTTGCGTCDAPKTCGADNVCACVPETKNTFCARLGKTCGQVTDQDNCGMMRTEDCGMCAMGQCKADNTCTVCMPESNADFCTRQGKTCGQVTGMDNCMQPRTVSSCGACGTDEVCNGNNLCECPDVSCQAGDQCGSVSNACGKSASCGMCGQDETCSNNMCSCPRPSCQPGQCGQISNACGMNRSCGGCQPGQTCNANNACVCEPESDAAFCSRLGKTCGMFTGQDNCMQARTASCGTCNAPATCQADNTCGCTPETDSALCAAESLECGSFMGQDSCMMTRNIASCGTCAMGTTCISGKCALIEVANPTMNLADRFGESVALSGDTLVVGAPGGDLTSPTIARQAGLVHVFTLTNGTWTLQQTLQASDAKQNTEFGSSVAIDGDNLIVGAGQWDGTSNNMGKVYIFTRSSGMWTERFNFEGELADSRLGTSVAIHGKSFAAGAPRDDTGGDKRGIVMAYRCTDMTDKSSCTTTKLTLPNPIDNDEFGTSVSMSSSYLIAGAAKADLSSTRADKDVGRVMIYANNMTWSALYDLRPSPLDDNFMGTGVATHGTRAIIGADYNDVDPGKAFTFEIGTPNANPEIVSLSNTLTLTGQGAKDRAGVAVALFGDYAATGAPRDDSGGTDTGRVYISKHSGAAWAYLLTLSAPVPAANERFGASVAASANHIAIGAPGDDNLFGRVFIYKTN